LPGQREFFLELDRLLFANTLDLCLDLYPPGGDERGKILLETLFQRFELSAVFVLKSALEGLERLPFIPRRDYGKPIGSDSFRRVGESS